MQNVFNIFLFAVELWRRVYWNSPKLPFQRINRAIAGASWMRLVFLRCFWCYKWQIINWTPTFWSSAFIMKRCFTRCMLVSILVLPLKSNLCNIRHNSCWYGRELGVLTVFRTRVTLEQCRFPCLLIECKFL